MITLDKIAELRKQTYRLYEEDLAAINRVARLMGHADLVVPPAKTISARLWNRDAQEHSDAWVQETKADLGLEALRAAVKDAEALLEEDHQ
jgi:hypothetical protein